MNSYPAFQRVDGQRRSSTGVEISYLTCQGLVAGYGRRQAIHDAVF